MKRPRQRNTTSIATDGIWAKYDGLQAAIDDIVLWMKARGFNTSVKTLPAFVREMKKNNYFEEKESDYLNALKKHLA